MAIAPPVGSDHPTLERIVFYANYLAYEHDLPVFIRPVRPRAPVAPVEKGPSGYFHRSYYDSLGIACEAINAIRLGPLGFVHFRRPRFQEEFDLDCSQRYSGVARELSLYAQALRQLDPLSEFLCYYRVIESVSAANGKRWVRSNLSRLSTFDFGFLHCECDDLEPPRKRRTNLFSVYRRRALARVRALNRSLAGKDIADYFYNENRCGIAHGGSRIKEYDFSYTIRDIAQYLYVLRLLARIGIDDHI